MKDDIQLIIKAIEESEKESERESRRKIVADLLKTKKINFEEAARRLITIYRDELVLEQENKRNKEVIAYFYKLLTVVSERRWMDGGYNNELSPVLEAISHEELKHGLAPDEFFSLAEMPPEIKDLNEKYDKILDQKQLETFEEFLSSKIFNFFEADLLVLWEEQSDIKKTEEKISKRKKEREDRKKPKELQLMNKYYSEFKKCYENQAYLSASALLGAALESLLLFILNKKDPQVIDKEIEKLKKGKVLQCKKLNRMGLNDLIELGGSVGVMPEIDHTNYLLSLKNMSGTIKDTRNFLHPGKILRDEVFNVPLFDQKDVDVLHAIFQVVKKINDVGCE